MKGWGGTSFIPVFEKVDAMQEEGEIIDCLFYLSDGYGSYPEKESDYPAFMVLPKQDYDYMQDANNDRIPGWIRTLKLDEE
jgi:predicted metal-dependent peptidase